MASEMTDQPGENPRATPPVMPRQRSSRRSDRPAVWPYTGAMAAVSALIASVNLDENTPMTIFLGGVAAAFIIMPPLILRHSLRTTR